MVNHTVIGRTQEERQSEKYPLPLVKMTFTCGCPVYQMVAQAWFQPTTTLTHTRSLRHTCTHLLSVLRGACWVHTHTTRLGFPPANAQQGMKPYQTTLSPISPLPLIQVNLIYSTNPWTNASFISQSCAVLTSVVSASLVHLRTSQCCPTLQKEVVWVSQSAAECFIRHPVHSALSPHSRSLCGQHWALCLFSLLSLLIISVSHAKLTQMHTVFQLSRFTVSRESRPRSGYMWKLGFQEPCANTERRLSSDDPALCLWVSVTTLHLNAATANFLETCLCVCVWECVLEHEMQEEWREITDKGMNRELQVSVVCWSSQQLTNKPFLCGVRPGFLRWRAHTHTRYHRCY